MFAGTIERQPRSRTAGNRSILLHFVAVAVGLPAAEHTREKEIYTSDKKGKPPAWLCTRVSPLIPSSALEKVGKRTENVRSATARHGFILPRPCPGVLNLLRTIHHFTSTWVTRFALCDVRKADVRSPWMSASRSCVLLVKSLPRFRSAPRYSCRPGWLEFVMGDRQEVIHRRSVTKEDIGVFYVMKIQS